MHTVTVCTYNRLKSRISLKFLHFTNDLKNNKKLDYFDQTTLPSFVLNQCDVHMYVFLSKILLYTQTIMFITVIELNLTCINTFKTFLCQFGTFLDSFYYPKLVRVLGKNLALTYHQWKSQ